MRILVDTYDTAFQNKAGGVHNRIEETVNALKKNNIHVDYFDKFTTNISDYDILHIFKLDVTARSLIVYAKKKGLKVVVSSIMPLEKGWVANFYWKIRKLPIQTNYKMLFEICENSDALIVETPREKDFLNNNYHVSNNKIKLIPNGASTLYNNSKLVYEKIGKKIDYVLLLARFDKNKNQLNVIKALKNTNINIIFIGGPDEKSIDYYNLCIKEADNEDNFHFFGWLDKNDPLFKSTLGNAKIILCSSFHETFGLSIIEGIIAGAIPIVSNTLPILDYPILNGCLSFNPNDIEEIRTTLYTGINENNDPIFMKNIESFFSWNQVAKQHIELYKQVLRND